jgi:hypothetical protein
MCGFVKPSGTFALPAARPAPIHRTTDDRRMIRYNLQLPVDAHLPHHAPHQGGSGVNPDQIFEKAHVDTLLSGKSLPCRAVCGVDLDQ